MQSLKTRGLLLQPDGKLLTTKSNEANALMEMFEDIIRRPDEADLNPETTEAVRTPEVPELFATKEQVLPAVSVLIKI